MKKQYYYTVNSLPHLFFGKLPPLEREDFLALSKMELEANDVAFLASVRLLQGDESAPSNLLTKWYAWEHAMRNELVKRRAPKLGLDAEDYMRGNDHDSGCARIAGGFSSRIAFHR